MNNKITTIEISLTLNTKTKLFSKAINLPDCKPNCNVTQGDLGYPGTLPLLNEQAVIKSIKMAKNLNMQISNLILFDRKHHFHPDQPKGFRITQIRNPFMTNGFIYIEDKQIIIRRAVLEEDFASVISKSDHHLIDNNKAGAPLLTITIDGRGHDGNSVMKIVKEVQKRARDLNISQATFENSTMLLKTNIINDEMPGDRRYLIYSTEEQGIVESINKTLNSNLDEYYCEIREENVKSCSCEIPNYKMIEENNIPPIQLTREFINSL